MTEDKTDAFIAGLKKDYFDDLEAAKAKNLEEAVFKTQPGEGAVIYTF